MLTLHPDLLRLALTRADSFQDVITILKANRQLYDLLSCTDTSPRVDSFLQMSSCQTPEQTLILEQLNARFNLKVSKPVTLEKLIWVHEYRYKHENLYSRLTAEAKNGNQVFVQQGLETWKDILRRIQKLLLGVPNHLIEGRLAHLWGLKLGNIKVFGGVTNYLDQSSRKSRPPPEPKIPYPRKLKTNRQIRDEYAHILYDPQVSDFDKRAIWSSQYAPFELPKLSEVKGDKKWRALLVKFRSEEIKSIDDDQIEAAFESGDIRFLDMMVESNEGLDYDETYYGILQLLKRGYWETLMIILTNPKYEPLAALVTPTPDDLIESLDTFKLSHIRLFGQGLLRLFEPFDSQEATDFKEAANEILDLRYLYGKSFAIGYQELFQEIQAEIKPQLEANLDIVQEAFSHNLQFPSAANLVIMNTILMDLSVVDYSKILGSMKKFFDTTPYFWIELWRKYGREQFEDSLIYLAKTFGIIVDGKGLTETVDVSLLRYVLGPESILRVHIEDETSFLRNLDMSVNFFPDAVELLLEFYLANKKR